MLLDSAIKKLVELGVATTTNNKYQYSKQFEEQVTKMMSCSFGKLKQLKLANEAGRKLIPEILAVATHKPTRHDIENMIVAYVCLKFYTEEQKLQYDKKYLPDLAYAVWYLNDNNPTLVEVEEWKI